MSSSVTSVPRSVRHAAPSVRRSIASRHVHTARGVHTTKATQRGAYTPYHQSYFGQHMVGCCPDTGLATGMTVSPNSRAASTSGTSQPSTPSYAPYFRSYYGTHMLDRTGGVRHMSTRPTRPALRAESSASAAVPEDAPGVGAEHIVLQSRPAKREAPAATAAADGPLAALSDAEVLEKLHSGEAPHHQLEVLVGDSTRAVELRRAFLGLDDPQRGGALPVSHFDTGSFYDQVKGANCENVVGFLTIPVGVVGPLVLDGEPLTVPMATTEGALIASTNRGARAIALSGGARSAVMRDGMTRAPAVQMPSVMEAARMRAWLEQPEVVEELKGEFSQTTRFGKLQTVDTYVAGRNVFIRFRCNTGDAMGMNMISKGVERVMARVSREFPEARVLALSGNVCMDKKPSAMNWIEGRGKSVAVEAILPGHVVTSVLKTTVADMVELNISKNLIGSAVAGSIGGNNAHASNIVSACFLATGQDPAQNVESSNCMTLMEPVNDGQDLHISCTMPSIEVGTVGGGTALPTQAACLDMLNVRGAAQIPGQHAQKLARVICATVLAGEISLMGALASGHLVSSHMRLNRAAPKKA